MDDNRTLTSPHPRYTGAVLPLGTRIADRYTLTAHAGRGGMGFIYRATDQLTGQHVALKQLHTDTSPDALHRFHREASLLAELHHPAIVSYVAHGVMEGGHPYLVMEWLEGETLAQRLARQPLGLSETLALLRRAAEGLELAHRQGIVHRDLKPANLLLRSGRPEDVVLLDFGLARHIDRAQEVVTGGDMVLGTPGYMAPEQAASQSDITFGADVFSLGCVLYECLTGRPPFQASHFAAALAKILFAEPLPLRALRDDLPMGLQVLLDAMLVKEPRRRLPDAARLLEALAKLEATPALAPDTREVRTSGLAGAEQQLFSVLLVPLSSRETPPQEGAAAERRLALRDSVRTLFAPYGAQVELLAEGSLVVTLAPRRGTATDLVMLAVRCALILQPRWPQASVVLVTGRGVFNDQVPVGEAMDRAGRLLRRLEQMPASSPLILMDEVTAGLLGPGFQLSRSDSGTFLLQGEQLDADESRPLLGKPTPCVGREQDLALLEFAYASCVEEPAARVLLVKAPAGTGKSRLRHEFLRRLAQKEQAPLVLLGRADAMTEGASYGLLGQVLRKLCGIVEGEDLETRRARLHERVAPHLPAARARETVEFLGELCAIPFPEESSPRLRAARREPQLMSTQVTQALVTFLAAECARQPVLLVLEDLHWGDALTVKLVNEVLRELKEQPLMVLALARPEVKELFPGLWAQRLQEIPLSGLSRKASTRLAREVLGPFVADSVIQRAVELSDGNVLFLEELIRMVAEGRVDAPPETVLAVLQARLLRMEPGVRRVLLAASIFGRTFWTGGVRTLLGWRRESEGLEEHLRRLVELEVIEPQPDNRFPSTDAYRFRHALLQEAAYSLVPDSHQLMGHQLAGAWLEQMGEPDPLVLATHYQRGHQPERAARFYTRAAERSFETYDLQGTLRCVEAAMACGVSDETRTRLLALQAVGASWMDQMSRVVELGAPVLSRLKEGSPLWCTLMGGMILAKASLQQESVGALCELLLRTTPEPEAVTAYVAAISCLMNVVVLVGERQQLELLLGRMMEAGAHAMAQDAMTRGLVRISETMFLHLHENRPWRAFLLAEEGIQDFLQIGSERNALLYQPLAGSLQAELGDLPGAKAKLRESLEAARRAEQRLLTAHALQHLMMVLAGSPEPAEQQEARALAIEYLSHDESTDPYSFRRGVAHTVLARLEAARGELSSAESHARTACATLVPFRSFLSHAFTVLSTVLLAQGRAVEARREAEHGERELERMGSSGAFAVSAHLALAEACFTLEDTGAGEAALRKALRCVRARASDIPEAAARERFLRQVPENARTLELAHQRVKTPIPSG